jgi:hypothetical protein
MSKRSMRNTIRYAPSPVTVDVKKGEDHAKTIEHMEYIATQREQINKGEELVKSIELRILMGIVDGYKKEYEKTGNKTELKTWKESVDLLKEHLKDIKYDNQSLIMQINEYKLAEKEYNKQHSCISRYFFWCCADSVDVLERDEDKQVNDSSSSTAYMRLPGQ